MPTKKPAGLLGELAELSDIWKSTDAPENAFAEVDDGEYDCIISAIEINKAKNSGRLQIKYELTINEGQPFAKRKLWKYDGLANADNIAWAKASLSRLNIECEDISELPSLLNDVKGLMVNITAKTKNEIQNYYFNELVEEVAPTPAKGKKPVKKGPVAEEEESGFSEGDEVEALYSKDGEWYEGAVTKVATDKKGNITYSVLFDGTDITEKVTEKGIKAR